MIDTDKPFLTLELFQEYYKTELEKEEQDEVNRLIIDAQSEIIALNNTSSDLIEDWNSQTITVKEKAIIVDITRMIVRYYFENGIDNQTASFSMNLGSKNISKSQTGDNDLADRVYNLYARTQYYSQDILLWGFETNSSEQPTTIKSSNVVPDLEEKPNANINPMLQKANNSVQNSDYINDQEILNNEIDNLEENVETIQAEQITQNNSIATNTSNINSITTTLEENSIGELIAKGTAGTLTEGTWLPISFSTIDKNTFGNIALSGNTFTITESINNLNVLLQGQTVNTNATKTIQLRLWNITTNLQVGDIQQIVISSVGEAKYQAPVNLSIGEYRIEIFATTGSGTITFNNYFISLLKFGGGTGAGAVKSSQLISDVETLPNTGFNQEITNLKNDKADITYVDTELALKFEQVKQYNYNDGTSIFNGENGLRRLTGNRYLEYYSRNNDTGEEAKIRVANTLQGIPTIELYGGTGAQTWIPTLNNHPTTKQYVDSKLSTLALELGISPQRIKELFPPSPDTERKENK